MLYITQHILLFISTKKPISRWKNLLEEEEEEGDKEEEEEEDKEEEERGRSMKWADPVLCMHPVSEREMESDPG